MLSFIFMLLGAAGIILFNGTVPPSGAPCNCIIPTPEPSAAQGTSSIFLVLGIIFFPMGLMKGGLPSLRRPLAAAPAMKQPGGVVVPPVKIASGALVAVGIVLLMIGIDVLFVPALVLLKNPWYQLSGVLLMASGALSVAWGFRKPKEL